MARLSIIQDIIALYYSIFSFYCCHFHAALVHASGHQIHPRTVQHSRRRHRHFLGFRQHAGYARYVEARKLWGQLMIASRSLLREVKRHCRIRQV
ncbi:bestrophin family ion channel [Shigella flexneri]